MTRNPTFKNKSELRIIRSAVSLNNDVFTDQLLEITSVCHLIS